MRVRQRLGWRCRHRASRQVDARGDVSGVVPGACPTPSLV